MHPHFAECLISYLLEANPKLTDQSISYSGLYVFNCRVIVAHLADEYELWFGHEEKPGAIRRPEPIPNGLTPVAHEGSRPLCPGRYEGRVECVSPRGVTHNLVESCGLRVGFSLDGEAGNIFTVDLPFSEALDFPEVPE